MSLLRSKIMKNQKITFERIVCYFIAFATPSFFAFQMIVIRPMLLHYWDIGLTEYCFHVILCTYSFVNVFGNMIQIIVVDSSSKNHVGQGRYCEHCKRDQPVDSWHCKTCNACIIERDHHCFFLSHCVGRYNLRYFVSFLTHMTIALALSIYYDCCAITLEYDFGSYLEITVCFAEMLRPSYFLYNRTWEVKKRLLATFWYVLVIVFFLCGRLLLFHLDNVMRGITCYEYYMGRIPEDVHLKRNIERVFGVRWYLAILWPFVESPLPDKSDKTDKDSS